MEKQRTIETALEAVQIFGISPDDVEILVLVRTVNGTLYGMKGPWYMDRIVEYLEEPAYNIDVCVDNDKTSIRAVFDKE